MAKKKPRLWIEDEIVALINEATAIAANTERMARALETLAAPRKPRATWLEGFFRDDLLSALYDVAKAGADRVARKVAIVPPAQTWTTETVTASPSQTPQVSAPNTKTPQTAKPSAIGDFVPEMGKTYRTTCTVRFRKGKMTNPADFDPTAPDKTKAGKRRHVDKW